MLKIFTVISLFTVALGERPLKQGCPVPIDIHPCFCTNSPFTYLECQHIDDAEIIRNVFRNSTRYGFTEVHIKYSALQYLPVEMFENVRVHALYLKNVTLVQLFDDPPKFLENLDTLHIENTRLLRGVVWKLLEPLTHLRVLNIYYNNIKTLGSDFSDYATKELKQISFYGTNTKSIKSGVFSKFVNLEKVAFENCLLTNLKRDIFPVPFNARYLYFNKNKLVNISEDLFTDMPQLQTLGLRNNQISILPESALRGSQSKLEFLQLEGNPIACDCNLNWLIKNKPPALSGHCATPPELKGDEIKSFDSSVYLKC